MATFSGLMEKMSEALKKFKNKGQLTEADVKAGSGKSNWHCSKRM